MEKGKWTFWPTQSDLVHGKARDTSWGSGNKNSAVGCHFLLGDHVLPKLFSMTHLSVVALQDMAHSFTELHKPIYQDKAVIHEGEIVKHRGVCHSAAHGVAKSWTQLSD